MLPAIKRLHDKSACNTLIVTVETAEIDELRALVS